MENMVRTSIKYRHEAMQVGSFVSKRIPPCTCVTSLNSVPNSIPVFFNAPRLVIPY
jgi:hypothetical protein